ncbi:MAG: sigma-70 family RNA polymerase sigma factor [Ferruginibacter sp.]
MQQQDTQIVERLKNGDLSAYDTLFVKYYKLLCVSAYFFLQDEQESKDIVQTFFIDIWEKKIYLQFQDDIKGYLHRAIKNRCFNHISKQKTRDKNHHAFAEMQDKAVESYKEPVPDYYIQLNNTLQGIACQKRVAIEMAYLKGKSYQEGADEMGISINSFKTHLKSGLKILRYGIKK